MARFDFDTLTDRTDSAAAKWADRTENEKRAGIVPMSVADMEFSCPSCVIRACEQAARHGIYGYTCADERFIQAVKGWMLRRHGLEISPEEITVIGGVVPGIALAVRAFTKPGEGVIVQPPVYPPFFSMAEANGRRLEKNPLLRDASGRYRMDFDGLERLASKPDVKLMVLCSPHNPAGRVWTREELERVRNICARNGVTMVSDEIHSDLVLRGLHTPMLNVDENTVMLIAPSKTFNIPGLQLAVALIRSPENRRRFVTELSSSGQGSVNYFGRAAAVAAYEEGGEWLDEALGYIGENYRVLASFFDRELPDLTVSPLEGTYLAWVDFRPLGMQKEELDRFLREDCGLILAPGHIFGKEGEGFERFNLALPRAHLISALDRLGGKIKEIQHAQ